MKSLRNHIVVMCVITILAGPKSLPAQIQATGTVFEDMNSDGRYNEGEPGIPGVRVSNGREVVVSDEQGRYRLPVGDETIVFITKPAGYMTPVDRRMLPKFYYIHQPGGSPEGLRYRGIQPTGPLPDQINFPLKKGEESNRFSAILFSDTQPQTEAEVDYIRDDVIVELLETEASFGMTMGDIMFDDLSLFPRYLGIVAQIGIPWYNVPGNHEMNLKAENDRYALETFKSYFGPPYYSFEYGDAYFVVLDNIDYKGTGESDPGDIRGSGGYVARISEDQLEWLKNDLQYVPDDKLVFITMHSPLRTYAGKPDNPGVNTRNRRDLFALLAGRPNLYAVAGHTHTTEHHYFGREDGFDGPGEFHHHVLATVSGSWWSGPMDERGIPVTEQRDGTPNGYHILNVDGTDLTVDYKAAGFPSSHQMRIVFDVAHHRHSMNGQRDFRHGELIDGRMTVDEVAAADIVVNLFDGGPKSVVSFSVGDRPAEKMERKMIADPYTTEMFQRNEATRKSWVNAIPSSHIWMAELPDDLTPGIYTITVNAIDEFGRKHHAHKILEITGSSAAGHGELKYHSH